MFYFKTMLAILDSVNVAMFFVLDVLLIGINSFNIGAVVCRWNNVVVRIILIPQSHRGLRPATTSHDCKIFGGLG